MADLAATTVKLLLDAIWLCLSKHACLPLSPGEPDNATSVPIQCYKAYTVARAACLFVSCKMFVSYTTGVTTVAAGPLLGKSSRRIQ